MARRVVLTSMQRTFIKHMAATGDATYAATKAGYNSPEVQGWRNMQITAVKESVYAAQMRRLEEEGLPIAVDAVIRNAGDLSIPAPARNVASKIIIDAVHKGREAAPSGKEPGEMTLAELEHMRRTAEHESMVWRKLADARDGRIDDAETLLIDDAEQDEEEAEIVPDEPEQTGVFG